MRKTLLPAIAAVSLLFAGSANAAYITFDDSDLSSITITAGDFERGFSVNGNLLTIGLGSSGSITLPDGAGDGFEGSWIDLGASGPGGSVEIFFALPGDPTGVTSGMNFTYTTDGMFATLSGGFGGFFGSPFFATILPTATQDGHTEVGFAPFLSVIFESEGPAPVPEPATLLMLAPALAFVAYRRHRSNATRA